MKLKWIFLVVISRFITCCSDVVFDQPQPISKNDVSILKDAWQGSYFDGDELFARLDGQGFYWQDRDKLVPWSSDTVHLRKMNGKYVLSMKLEKGWEVYVFEKHGDQLTLGSFEKPLSMNKEDYFNQLRAVVNRSHTNGETLVLEPTKREFKKMLRNNDLFEQVVLERRE